MNKEVVSESEWSDERIRRVALDACGGYGTITLFRAKSMAFAIRNDYEVKVKEMAAESDALRTQNDLLKAIAEVQQNNLDLMGVTVRDQVVQLAGISEQAKAIDERIAGAYTHGYMVASGWTDDQRAKTNHVIDNNRVSDAVTIAAFQNDIKKLQNQLTESERQREQLRIALKTPDSWRDRYYRICKIHAEDVRQRKELRNFRAANFSIPELKYALDRKLSITPEPPRQHWGGLTMAALQLAQDAIWALNRVMHLVPIEQGDSIRLAYREKNFGVRFHKLAKRIALAQKGRSE